MNTLDIILFFKRHYPKIILVVLIIPIITGIFSKIYLNPKEEISIFLTIGIDRGAAQIDNENTYEDLITAADKFGETIKGWFKNPGFLNKITQKIDQNLIITSVKKQALQNLVIQAEIPLGYTNKQTIGEGIIDVLQSEINQYNSITASSYKIVNFNITLGIKNPPHTVNVIVGSVISFFLIIVLLYFFEVMQGTFITENDIVKILKKTPLFVSNKNSQISLTSLGSYLVGVEDLIIISGLGLSIIEIVPKLAGEIAQKITGETLLVDYELDAKKLTSFLKQQKNQHLGITDLSDHDQTTSINFISELQDYGLKFISAGTKKALNIQTVNNLITSFEKIIFYTDIFQHTELLHLPNSTLILFLRIGQTKLQDLKQIKNLFSGNVIPVILI